MRNIHVNATSHDEWGTVNTDGSDTWNSRDILMENWIVDNGDDCIAAKGNTTNLHVRNVTRYHGNGMTSESVGQYSTMPDYSNDTLFEDITLVNSEDGAYVKTWQGDTENGNKNGDFGGGGSGTFNNITFRNFRLTNFALPIQISQCIYTEATGNACDASKMQKSNITWQNFTGTSRCNIAASLHFAGLHHCPGIIFKDVNITAVNLTLGLPFFNTTVQQEVYQCANIVNQNTTSGIPCNRYAPNDFGQGMSMNVQ